MYTVNIAKVPAQIRALRKQRGLSQEDLAKKAGTNQPTISRLERSQMVLNDLEMLTTITDALDAQIQIDVLPKKVNLERVRPNEVKPKQSAPAAAKHFVPKRTKLSDRIEF